MFFLLNNNLVYVLTPWLLTAAMSELVIKQPLY